MTASINYTSADNCDAFEFPLSAQLTDQCQRSRLDKPRKPDGEGCLCASLYFILSASLTDYTRKRQIFLISEVPGRYLGSNFECAPLDFCRVAG